MSDQETDNEQGLEPGADQLTDELARKYDPERMLGMVSRRAGKGERLDHSIRAKYEKRFGVDLGHVRVYTGEFAEEFNRQRQEILSTGSWLPARQREALVQYIARLRQQAEHEGQVRIGNSPRLRPPAKNQNGEEEES